MFYPVFMNSDYLSCPLWSKTTVPALPTLCISKLPTLRRRVCSLGGSTNFMKSRFPILIPHRDLLALSPTPVTGRQHPARGAGTDGSPVAPRDLAFHSHGSRPGDDVREWNCFVLFYGSVA